MVNLRLTVYFSLPVELMVGKCLVFRWMQHPWLVLNVPGLRWSSTNNLESRELAERESKHLERLHF